MTQKTAVDYLYERLSTLYLFKDALLAKRALEEAKEMEKQQIIDAYKYGNQSDVYFKPEQYYNETFKSEQK